jgi:hypothetical protein
MKFYLQEHQECCGIDLHTKWVYIYGLDSSEEIGADRNLNTDS